MQAPNKEGELCIAVCPDCGFCSVCDPAWMQIVGQTLSFPCDNCCFGEYKDHLIKKFVEFSVNKE